MNLKSFGCSFIFGSELSDERQHYYSKKSRMSVPSNLTWPAHLARHLNANYNCYARPGSGNLQIAEKVLSQLATDAEDSLYVIGWTWIDRFDYTSSDETMYNNFWKTVMPIDEDATAKVYYKNLHSEYRDKLTNLMYMKLTIDSLLQKKYSFVMTYMDSLLFDTKWHTTPAIVDLQNYIRPYLTQFNETNFLEWSKKNKFPITDIGHPLEQAHQAAGDYIIQSFDKKSTGAHCHPV